MKVIIAGSRTITSIKALAKAIKKSQFEIAEIVSGGARGVDRLGEQYAKAFNIPLKVFPADWDSYGKAAGHIRNKQMAEYAQALILIWTGDRKTSRGSYNMLITAKEKGIKVFEEIFNEQ